MSKIDLENLRLLTDITYPVTPIPDSDAWNALREKVGFEGPYVLKYDQKYYMFYSTWARGYEVGIAAADTPDGEWKMYPQPMYGAIDQKWCNEYGGIYEDNYENCVMREYRMAAVRRSILNLCFLHVSSNIRGIQSADGRLSTRLIGESICM